MCACPTTIIKKVVDMPNMEIEVQLCGDDEYFAEGALIELQQGSKKIKPIDIGKAERGRKNEGSGPAYRSRFTALFAYEKFDPTAASVFVINLQDGKEARIPADFCEGQIGIVSRFYSCNFLWRLLLLSGEQSPTAFHSRTCGPTLAFLSLLAWLKP